METQIFEINEQSLEIAKKYVENDIAIGFPTETVYGLAANAYSDEAVRSIYRIKGRPSDNPLIVHVHKDFDINELVYDEQPYAKLLREKFLPGPLTMVYKSKGKVSPFVSCGIETLALRVPSHEGCQKFLKFVNLPIAAPSANISKHISPVTSGHVFEDLKGLIPLILEGGKCQGGIESTVLDVTGKIPVVLRSGLISREMIASVAGDCELYVPKSGEVVRSPGLKYKHYAPKCKTAIFKANQLDKVKEIYREYKYSGKIPYILCEDIYCSTFAGYNVLNLGKTAEEVASNLYFRLHQGEAVADIIIAVEPEEKTGVMTGVINRLSKACANEN